MFLGKGERVLKKCLKTQSDKVCFSRKNQFESQGLPKHMTHVSKFLKGDRFKTVGILKLLCEISSLENNHQVLILGLKFVRSVLAH